MQKIQTLFAKEYDEKGHFKHIKPAVKAELQMKWYDDFKLEVTIWYHGTHLF